jgi:hypothetical protein
MALIGEWQVKDTLVDILDGFKASHQRIQNLYTIACSTPMISQSSQEKSDRLIARIHAFKQFKN